ncbi:MAG TPA: replication-relaxation family protein, partial [Acidimicrobiia bacterium]
QIQLAARLTSRDRWLAHMLHEHAVLTTHQVTRLAWPSTRAANLRLHQLYQWRVVDRFQPFLNLGTAPMHYVLDIAGGTALAHEHGLTVADLPYRHDHAIAHAHSLRLAHTIGVNDVLTTLIAAARQPGVPSRLTVWWSETRCARHYGDLVRPDAYARWQERATSGRAVEVEWFLEYDLGTETLDRLAGKLGGYQRLADSTGITTPVLIWLPSNAREATARRALAAAVAGLDRPRLVPIATTSADHPAGTDPAGARWLPIPTPAVPVTQHRVGLAGLTGVWPHLTPPPAGPVSTSAPAGASDGRGLPPPPPMPPAPAAYPTTAR